MENGGSSEKGTSYMFIHVEQQQLHWRQQSIHPSFVCTSNRHRISGNAKYTLNM